MSVFSAKGRGPKKTILHETLIKIEEKSNSCVLNYPGNRNYREGILLGGKETRMAWRMVKTPNISKPKISLIHKVSSA